MTTSIKKKILTAFLSVCVAALLVSGGISLVQLQQIRDISVKSNTEIGTLVGAQSSESLVNLSLADLHSLAEEKGASINNTLQGYANALNVMADYVTNIYSKPEDYKPLTVKSYKDVSEGELALHWFLEPSFIEHETADALENSGLEYETYLLGNTEKIFSAMMNTHPEINAICIATSSGQNLQYDKYAFNKAEDFDVNLVYFSSHERDWYIEAKKTGALFISDTYEDAGGRGLTVTMSMPIVADGAFKGVICFDIRIGDLDEQIKTAALAGSGYIELLGNGKIISSPELISDPDAPLPSYWDSVSASDGGSTRTVKNGEKVFVTWSVVPLTGWKIVYIVSESGIIAPAVDLADNISKLTDEATANADTKIGTAILLTVGLLIVVVLIASYIAYRAAVKISRPVSELTDGAKIIGGGNLEHELAVSTNDELKTLAITINKMVADIRNITSEKERIGAELNVAANIQTSMLPHIFPAFPHIDAVDIYAAMIPAKEVGGDFYDFFIVGDKMWTVIADVSGKGVPAALFMVIAKTLIKSNAQSGMSPKEVLEITNNTLCENNDAEMFVTVFAGCLDMKTGVYTFSNGGHERPILGRKGEDWELIKIKRKAPLGTIENIKHIEEEWRLSAGDRVYLYTDGVTEAENKSHAMFGERQTVASLNRHGASDLRTVLDGVKSDIDAFADGAAQFDDITMLAFTYNAEAQNGDNT